MEKFKKQSKLVTWQIKSKFNKEMSSKSVVVSRYMVIGNLTHLILFSLMVMCIYFLVFL